jgi:ectoine hydroxylase-related dioxygenase (phytanoyl-CoA dioxygenase family)
VLQRIGGNFASKPATVAPADSAHLEREGYVVLRAVFSAREVAALTRDIRRVFREYPRDRRAGGGRAPMDDECFRYEMLNRSAACQRAIAHPAILATIEPLLGEDCHVIANTAWRNTAQHDDKHGGQAWHIDAGPHIPLAEGTRWPRSLPHPVFVIGTHIYLQDCSIEDGPTGVIPRSHLSGRMPPVERLMDDRLKFRGRGVVPLLARTGDVGMFVSDVWHRRMPTQSGDRGRFFLQVHYGRRDIAQRLRTTDVASQLSADALRRARSARQKTLIGLHSPGYYDG